MEAATTISPLQAGDEVTFGGQIWRVATISNGKAYLITKNEYTQIAWNLSGKNTDASELFNYLRNNENSIVKSNSDWVEDTIWTIDSYSGVSGTAGSFYYNGNQTDQGIISPSSFNQKIGILSADEWGRFKSNIGTTTNQNWTRTPYRDSVWFEYQNNFYMQGANVDSHYIRPALWLKAEYSYKNENNQVVRQNQIPSISVSNANPTL